MKAIKGFVTIEQYIDNNSNQVAPLGELSTWSSTYSKDKGIYTHTSHQGFGLTTFKNIETTDGTKAPVVADIVDKIMLVVKSCMAYSAAHIRPLDTSDLKTTISTEYTGRITNFNIGALVDNGVVALPEWLSWTDIDNNGASIKIWLADQSFSSQYDEYEIDIVAPLAVLDTMFQTYQNVVTILDSRSVVDLVDLIQAAKGSNPETFSRVYSFDLLNTTDSTQTHKTNWGVIIYGRAGDNVDTIKDAIIAYTMAHSAHTRTEWETIIPSLFKRTEFIVIPRWDKVSISNLSILSSLYSSILDPNECYAFAKAIIPFYSAAVIDSDMRILPYDYKALSLLAIPSESNESAKRELNVLFPDYIPVSSTSNDFGRMQIATQDWVVLIGELIVAAETATEFNSIPSHLRKITRGGVLFISALHGNINYMVAARSNAAFGIIGQ